MSEQIVQLRREFVDAIAAHRRQLALLEQERDEILARWTRDKIRGQEERRFLRAEIRRLREKVESKGLPPHLSGRARQPQEVKA